MIRTLLSAPNGLHRMVFTGLSSPIHLPMQSFSLNSIKPGYELNVSAI